jgi:gamma-glutamylcyclotransferase (GGCT)/AIG2-like uncharacterized protein YtfP
MHILRHYIKLLETTLTGEKKTNPKEKTELVFVYGSLKAGYHNDRFLQTAKLLGKAISPPRFALLDLGMFPAAIRGEHILTGEIYEVDAKTMRNLDRLEGNGRMYQRELCPFRLGGKQVKAWIYVYLHDDGFDPVLEPNHEKHVTW